MRVLWCVVFACLLTGCAGFSSFTADLNKRGVASCVEGNINVGSVITGGSGMLHTYTGTGGQAVGECIEYFKNLRTRPQERPPADQVVGGNVPLGEVTP